MKMKYWLLLIFPFLLIIPAIFHSIYSTEHLIEDLSKIQKTAYIGSGLLTEYQKNEVITQEDIVKLYGKNTPSIFPKNLDFPDAESVPKKSSELIALRQKVFLLQQDVNNLRSTMLQKHQHESFYFWEFGICRTLYLILLWVSGVLSSTILTHETKRRLNLFSRNNHEQ